MLRTLTAIGLALSLGAWSAPQCSHQICVTQHYYVDGETLSIGVARKSFILSFQSKSIEGTEEGVRSEVTLSIDDGPEVVKPAIYYVHQIVMALSDDELVALSGGRHVTLTNGTQGFQIPLERMSDMIDSLNKGIDATFSPKAMI